MRRIRLDISYDGTRYVGWQMQPNGLSIEEVLNGAISKLLKEEIHVIGASRTDSAVHADQNVAVFNTESRIPAEKFKFAINEFLPHDITVQESWEVPLDWHPRKQCTVKTYEYRILNRKTPFPKEWNYAYYFYYGLDLEKMRRASDVLKGTHDFKSFCSIHTDKEDTVRTIYDIQIDRVGDIISIKITGNGFLYNMVRIIVGTLIKISTGIFPADAMPGILAACDRSKAGNTAPPQGLTLKEIHFEKDEDYDAVLKQFTDNLR